MTTLRTLLALLVMLTAFAVRAADSRPNIIIILADDLGDGDVSCLNAQSKIQTPHIDRLAAQGVTFTDAHAPSSVCTPTRYAILTGRYCWRSRLKAGVLGGYSPRLIEPGRLTIAEMLRRSGYNTAAIGKWHLGLGWATKEPANFGDTIAPKASPKTVDFTRPIKDGPLSVGFDYFFGIPASLDMDPYVYIENDHAVEPATEHTAASPRPAFWRAGPIAPGFKHVEVLPTMIEKAEAYITRRAQAGGPFFLYLALPAPHAPIVPSPEFVGRSKAGVYGDFVMQTDDAVGRVLATLERLKLSDNTLVVFTSDNGAEIYYTQPLKAEYGHSSSGVYRGFKRDLWDGGHHVPFIARWPGHIKAATHNDALICLTDLFATSAAIVDYKLPNDAAEDSLNMLPDLLGAKLLKPTRDVIIHHSGSGFLAIRKGDTKLIPLKGSGGNHYAKGPNAIKPDDPKGQVYDMKRDPSEQENLYQRYPETVKELTELLQKYRKDGRSVPRR